MNSRERVLTALSHREPDRVPFDLGSSSITGIHRDAYRALRSHLALADLPNQFTNMHEQIVRVHDDVLSRLSIDVEGAAYLARKKSTLKTLDMGDYTGYYDEYGIGWRMPKTGGFYHDMFFHPMRGVFTVADIERYPWPDPLAPERFQGMREAAEEIADKRKRAVMVGSISSGPLEMASWMRGYIEYFTDVAQRQDVFCALIDKVTDRKIAYWGKMFETLDGYLDIAQEADDFCGQDRILIPPDIFRRLVVPRYKRLFDFIHSHSKAKIFFHSCGAVREVIPDLIEAGIDILNPVQLSAAGMDSAELKREFGKDLCFWGGGVDTQRILPRGTEEEVREEVKRRIHDFMPGGGFVFNTVHNIQADVPPRNLVAMWETLQKEGVY